MDNWRVFRVNQPENVEMIFEHNAPFSHFLADSMISHNEKWVAFGSSIGGATEGGALLVADLNSGQIVLQLETHLQVCGVEWLDNDTLLYNVYSQRICSSPAGTWILDIEKNIQLEITDGLEGVVSVSLNR